MPREAGRDTNPVGMESHGSNLPELRESTWRLPKGMEAARRGDFLMNKSTEKVRKNVDLQYVTPV